MQKYVFDAFMENKVSFIKAPRLSVVKHFVMSDIGAI